LEKFREDCIPWEGAHAGTGEDCEEEGAAETCDELTATPISHRPVPLRGRRWRTWEGWEERVLTCVFISAYPTLTFNWQ